ncbi:MAG: hypothetical protein ACREV6_17905 [Clostridium sp.]|uniref:hypothetical protein n=1 Tax=Clostridium sp. TaxID=1506 RepID=UPI003D6CA79E
MSKKNLHLYINTKCSRTNAEEAMEVVRLVKDILNNRKENETIGVITFNITQRDLITLVGHEVAHLLRCCCTIILSATTSYFLSRLLFLF